MFYVQGTEGGSYILPPRVIKLPLEMARTPAMNSLHGEKKKKGDIGLVPTEWCLGFQVQRKGQTNIKGKGRSVRVRLG